MSSVHQDDGYVRYMDYTMSRMLLPLVILKLLSKEPMRRIQIENEVDELANGRFNTSCLLAINHLVEDGCVEKEKRIGDLGYIVGEYYHITSDGRELLELMQDEFNKTTNSILRFMYTLEEAVR